MIPETLERILITFQILAHVVHIFIPVITQHFSGRLHSIRIDLMQIKILTHDLRVCQKRLCSDQGHGQSAALEMNAVDLVSHHPVFDDLKNISLFHRIRKIKLHDNLNTVLMQAAHHAAELLARIAACSIGCFRCKIKCVLVSPAIDPLRLRRFCVRLV